MTMSMCDEYLDNEFSNDPSLSFLSSIKLMIEIQIWFDSNKQTGIEELWIPNSN